MKRALLLLLLATSAYAGGDPVGTISTTIGGSTPQGGGGPGNPGLTSLIMGGGPSATMGGAPVQSYATIRNETATYTQQIQSYQAQSVRIEQILIAQRQQAASQPSLQQVINSTRIDTGTRITNVQDQWVARKVLDSQAKVTGEIIAAFPTQGGELRQEFSTWTTFSMDRKKTLLLSDQYAETTQRYRANLGAINRDVYPYSEIALEAGLTSLNETARIAGGAGGSFAESYAESTAMLDIAKGLLDVGLSFTPGVSVGKDAYEALTGKSLIDGADLDLTSRSFAVLGVATAGGSNIVKASFKGLVRLGETLHARGLLRVGFDSAIKLTESNIVNIVRHTPITQGALHAERIGDEIAREFQAMTHISDTFRSGTYYTYETTKTRTLWRVASVDASKVEDVTKVLSKDTTWAHKSPFWTSIQPSSPTQVLVDSALERSWGSKANVWIKIEVPAGVVMHEGATAGIQRIGHNMSEFVGGGNQIYFKANNIDKEIPREWISEIGRFVE